MHAIHLTGFRHPEAHAAGGALLALRRAASGTSVRAVLDRAAHPHHRHGGRTGADRGQSWELLEEMLGSGIERFDLE